MRHSVRAQQRKRFRTPTRKVASELAGLSPQQTGLGTASETAKIPPRNDHTRPGGEIVLNIASLSAAVGLLTVAALSQLPNSSKAQDENELRKIESETAKFEQQNDSSIMGLLADDWVYLGARVLTKSEFGANVKQNFVTHNHGPNPYAIEKKNTRVDLFRDTAVVTYTKEYRQTPDTTQFFDEDDTDVFTRSSKGWQLRLTKTCPVHVESRSN